MNGPSERRPPVITLAVLLLSLALLLGFSILLFGWRVPAIAWSTLLLVGALLLAAARRRNWARWTLLGITLVSLAMTWDLVRFQLGYGRIVPVATVAQLVLEAAGFALLFGPAAARWYRRRRAGDVE